MIARVITAAIVSDPLTVRVNVGSVRMSSLVAIIAVLRGLLTSGLRTILSRAGLLSLGRGAATIFPGGRLLSSSRGRTTSRDVSPTNFLTAATAFLAASVLTVVLSKSADGEQQGHCKEPGNFPHVNPF